MALELGWVPASKEVGLPQDLRGSILVGPMDDRLAPTGGLGDWFVAAAETDWDLDSNPLDDRRSRRRGGEGERLGGDTAGAPLSG